MKHHKHKGRHPGPAPKQPPTTPKTVTTKRDATEQDELAVRLLAEMNKGIEQAKKIAALQVEVANLKLTAATREKQIIEEKYGLRGNVSLNVTADGKRTLTIITTEAPNSTTDVPAESAESEQQPVDEGANQTAEPTAPPVEAPKSS